MTEPELRDELVSRAAADWQQAASFFAAVDDPFGPDRLNHPPTRWPEDA